MLGVGLALEQRQSQQCELCGQEILARRQNPINAITIHGHSMCPSCRQNVSASKEYDPQYRRMWLRFISKLKLDR